MEFLLKMTQYYKVIISIAFCQRSPRSILKYILFLSLTISFGKIIGRKKAVNNNGRRMPEL
jgi:hypothetical protein